MKTKTLILLFLSIISLSAFSSPQPSNKVIITGVIENSNIKMKNFVEVAINRIAFGQISKKFKVDDQGCFKCEFTVATPTDVWIDYKTGFLIAVHPGDSIHVVFDGSKDQMSDLLKTIQFSGSAAKLNQDIAMLQKLYFDSNLYFYGNKKTCESEIERLNPSEYIEAQTKLKNSILKTFVDTTNPIEESKLWAQVFLTADVLQNVEGYRRIRLKNNKSDSLALSFKYDSLFFEMLPITESMNICGTGMSQFVRLFYIKVLMPPIIMDVNKTYKTMLFKSEDAIKEFPHEKIMDSVTVNGIIKYTRDTLLRQMVLTDYFMESFRKDYISGYEKHIDVVNEYIVLPNLKYTLAWHYEDTKKKVANPILNSETKLKQAANSTVSAVIDSIVTKNKNKVIYIDCWATWCGACLEEMPSSKKLMNDMKGKDVAFVYICINSFEKECKALIAKHQLEGEHYLLSQTQSDDMRRIFEINGIPHYIMIDKSGKVLGKDYNLRPNEAKAAIEKLLK